MRISKIRNDNLLKEKVLVINRVSKTVTGGRTMRFAVFTAVGDGEGSVGIGLSKSKNISDAVKKSLAQAKRSMNRYSLKGSTVPHEAMGKFSATKIFVKPAPKGKGLSAGSVARDILELVGVSDIYAKIIGRKNKINIAKATLEALSQMKTYKEVAALRGRKI